MKLAYNPMLLIASPSDVPNERNIVENLIPHWNKNKGEDMNVVVTPIRWEKNLAITSNAGAQELINEQLVSKADIIVAIFWSKFGTPTKNSESGTLEEIEQFLIRKKPVIMYFMDKKINPNSISPKQLQSVQDFQHKYKDQGVYKILKTTKELQDALFSDITYNVNKILPKESSATSSLNLASAHSPTEFAVNVSTSEQKTEQWYELSISELIGQYLKKQNLEFVTYIRGISFTENCNLWRSITSVTYAALLDKAKLAREYAFDKKYGQYDYSKDLRTHYKSIWYKEITQILNSFLGENYQTKSVIGVGSNNGSELLEIFPNPVNRKLNLEVLEISSVAISNGQELFKSYPIKFHSGSMEDSPLQKEHYDIYLNLRSIHSSGVDIKMTVAECLKVLKPGGVAIISVSNGYLTSEGNNLNDLKEVTGMYDSGTNTFSSQRPYNLAGKIRSYLERYGFRNCSITTGKSEIFIYAIK
jgi:SAM-dependent methyltransferase